MTTRTSHISDYEMKLRALQLYVWDDTYICPYTEDELLQLNVNLYKNALLDIIHKYERVIANEEAKQFPDVWVILQHRRALEVKQQDLAAVNKFINDMWK